MSVNVGLLVTLKAKPGKEADVVAFLESGQAIVEQEPGTITWYAIKIDDSTFGIFDTFNDDAGRQAHLSGDVAKALMAQAPDLFGSDPDIKPVDVIASKGS